MHAPARWVRLLAFAAFTAVGIWMITLGHWSGWVGTVLFGLCLLVTVLEPVLPKSGATPLFQLVITEDQIACEHPKRKRESIRWEDVNCVWYITTSDGPWFPDEWYVLEGKDGGCSFPTEALGFDRLLEEFPKLFPGFDWEPVVHGGTDDARYLCWRREQRAITSG
jgi:hypothetical protein